GVAALAGGCSELGTSWDGGVGLSRKPEPPVATEAARAELAPTGKLRVALQLSNEVLVEGRGENQLGGVAVELGQRIAKVLGVPFEGIPYPSGGRLTEAAGRGEWDIAFLSIETGRAAALDFSRPYMQLEGAVLVP